MLKQTSGFAALLLAGALASSAFAQPVSVGNRASLGGNDFVNWASAGEEFDYLGESFSTTSVGGLGITVSGATESENGFERADQGSSWFGNFGDGSVLVWTGFAEVEQIISIAFATPVFGAGAQIQSDFFGDFTAALRAYDSADTLIYSDTFAGFSSDAGDNSAIFLGALDSVESIARMEFAVEGTGTFAINQVDILRTRGVPDSGGGVIALLMLASLAGMHWYHRKLCVQSR
jgi:hypothetical protein